MSDEVAMMVLLVNVRLRSMGDEKNNEVRRLCDSVLVIVFVLWPNNKQACMY